MILRRVIEHFRKQEWTVVALDFVIVVVGVFVGLQVDNWNQARADSQREAFYLAALRDDFSVVIAELERDIAHHEQIANSMTLLIEQSIQERRRREMGHRYRPSRSAPLGAGRGARLTRCLRKN